jgi:hypothetical protein
MIVPSKWRNTFPGSPVLKEPGQRRVTDAIPRLLTELGATCDEVASALRADGITALRGATTFRNPIVRYINRHLDIGGHISLPIGCDALTVVRDGNRRIIRLPQAIGAFLDRFHAGQYPQVEET